MHTYTHIHIHTRTHAHAHTYMHTHIYTHIHTHIHTPHKHTLIVACDDEISFNVDDLIEDVEQVCEIQPDMM